MGVQRFEFVQRLPVSLDQAWDFFSSPANLSKITPSYMNFKILSPDASEKMFAGKIIEYHVHPLLNIPMYWVTEITHVKEREYFVDEQRFGPYAMWHHLHQFKEIDGGIEMKDILHYKVPMGFLGSIANVLFIKKQVKQIFDYRYQVLESMFGRY
ncbi:MAG: SRPBCC family protein [Cytophagaceae bacterium]|jgi:ligand-binding SRPBCC domain-containing protein|nr:SRPBCC family protein [Cytophagaceae bacterium]